jgi:quercetin dioxygenase-like cupin family protein
MITRSVAMAGLVAGAMTIFSVSAMAGQCPAEHLRAPGQGQKAGATMPKDVTDTVLGMIELAKEPVAIDGRQFRLRRLVIQPGGEVPWHGHEDRPAIIYIVQGEVMEYSSDCAVPIVHKAGDASVEDHRVAHWWKNAGSEPVVLISADLLRQEDSADMM